MRGGLRRIQRQSCSGIPQSRWQISLLYLMFRFQCEQGSVNAQHFFEKIRSNRRNVWRKLQRSESWRNDIRRHQRNVRWLVMPRPGHQAEVEAKNDELLFSFWQCQAADDFKTKARTLLLTA